MSLMLSCPHPPVKIAMDGCSVRINPSAWPGGEHPLSYPEPLRERIVVFWPRCDFVACSRASTL